jgi:hypothetical protein
MITLRFISGRLFAEQPFPYDRPLGTQWASLFQSPEPAVKLLLLSFGQTWNLSTVGYTVPKPLSQQDAFRRA